MSLPERLRVASRIRLVMKELYRKVAALPDEDKQTASPRLVMLLSTLASLLGTEVVVHGVSLADQNRVKLLVADCEMPARKVPPKDEPNDQPHVSTSGSIQTEVPHVKRELTGTAMAGGAPEEDDDLDSCFVDDVKEEPPSEDGDQPDDVEQQPPVPKREPTSYLNLASVMTARGNSDESVDLFDDVDEVQEVKQEQPSQLLVADVEESESQPDDEESYTQLRFYEVATSTVSQNTLFLIPDVNYCTCDQFQKSVLRDASSFTCGHVVAAWLSGALSSAPLVATRIDTLQVIARHISERTFDFH